MDNLKNELQPLYKELLDVAQPEDCIFCVQWGKNYPVEQNKGILFVGKAVNGWITKEKEMNVLFGSGAERIFDRADQMQWVENLERNKGGYDTKKSSFWRVNKQISQKFYPDNWSSHIAWSNLCKIAPFKGGNPNNTLYYNQRATCQKILEKEIEILSPKYVVMLTSGWEKDFLLFLNDNQPAESIHTETWGRGYKINVYRIRNTIFIASVHPQGKDEQAHVEVITRLIKNTF